MVGKPGNVHLRCGITTDVIPNDRGPYEYSAIEEMQYFGKTQNHRFYIISFCFREDRSTSKLAPYLSENCTRFYSLTSICQSS